MKWTMKLRPVIHMLLNPEVTEDFALIAAPRIHRSGGLAQTVVTSATLVGRTTFATVDQDRLEFYGLQASLTPARLHPLARQYANPPLEASMRTVSL